jgi:hypothetical protein
VVPVQLPREDEGVAYVDDQAISNRVAETLASSLAVNGAEVFLDTFVDHDRGYYPRNGLLDRRYNPRSSYHVFRCLMRLLGRGQEALKMTLMDGSAGIRAFVLETQRYPCVLLLADEELNRLELDLSWLPNSSARDGAWKWIDLRTGKSSQVRWKLLPIDGCQVTLDVPPGRFAPALLVLDV